MPGSEQILAGLALIANRFLPLAVAWHVVLVLAAAALVLGVRPSNRAAALLLVVPLASVSTLAWTTSSPFNGMTFASISLVLALIGTRVTSTPVARARNWALVLGGSTLVYAWVYLHFLDAHHPALYLIAAPMGLLPCPTLAMVLGAGLCAQGFGSRAWALVTGAAGLFFALFGIVRLGVWLDSGLLVASVATFALARRRLNPTP
jgi:hypothetical protein